MVLSLVEIDDADSHVLDAPDWFPGVPHEDVRPVLVPPVFEEIVVFEACVAMNREYGHGGLHSAEAIRTIHLIAKLMFIVSLT